ncbi:(2Fe-2S)-binding protein [Dethiosulfatarculus sandiegensis]|uniref:Proline dehydrogenase n=1 Tax=Dethiosulfatarculus sandiegensis TaxID=1429043 RepID=A0A0D2JRG6_9BACT|nr:(2Fe-2S)-binding protein [Dethiosulfatarculus sandiegensis]KIX12065.1 proline dehydrogenase [Dethiosulfatarculus sandiegensis]
MEAVSLIPGSLAGKIEFTANGKTLTGYEGQSVAAALWANGIISLGTSKKKSRKRGCLCGMGVCYGCLVTINGQPRQRACMTQLEPGMEIITDEN